MFSDQRTRWAISNAQGPVAQKQASWHFKVFGISRPSGRARRAHALTRSGVLLFGLFNLAVTPIALGEDAVVRRVCLGDANTLAELSVDPLIKRFLEQTCQVAIKPLDAPGIASEPDPAPALGHDAVASPPPPVGQPLVGGLPVGQPLVGGLFGE